jgi:hypothetical protein
MCWLDDMVTDFCQNADKYEKKYNQIYVIDDAQRELCSG